MQARKQRPVIGHVRRGDMANLLKLILGALPDATNAAEEMARYILGLRAAGKADEVTEAMMSAADDSYMYANTPLDMSQEARMARADEMGFDVDKLMYRGSPQNEPVIDRKYLFSSDNPYVASTYAKGGGSRFENKNIEPVVAPMLTRQGNVFQIDRKGGDYGRIPIDEPILENNDTLRNQFGEEIKGWTVNGVPTTDTNKIANLALNQFDSVQFDNMVDRGSESYYKYGPQEYATLPNGKIIEIGKTGYFDTDFMGKANQPSTVRINRAEDVSSKFARFDPEFRNLRNLSASILATIGFSGLAEGLRDKSILPTEGDQ
jgi:hypothetical protein